MAIVNGSLQEGYKDAAWFAANPTLVLLVGQKVNLEQTGTYKLGDGTSQLSALSFLGASGSGLSGLTTNKVLKATSSTTAGNSNITDDVSGVTAASPNGNNALYSYDTVIGFGYSGAKTSEVYSNDTSTKVKHEDLIELAAPSVTKNGVEVATVNDIPSLLHKINTPISHTGTTSATVIHSYEIYAGSLAANDFLKFSLRHFSTNNANSKTIKLWANTSNTIAGATQLATYTYTTNSGGVFWFKRTMFFQNSLTSQKIINTTQPHANDEVSYPNNSDPSLTLNFANSVWILIEVTLANAADTFTLNAYMNKIER